VPVPPEAEAVAQEVDLLDPRKPRARLVIVVAVGILLTASVLCVPTQGAVYLIEHRDTGADYWMESAEHAADAIQWRWVWARTLSSRRHAGYHSWVIARVYWPLLAGVQGAILVFAGLGLTYAVRRERRWRAGLGAAPIDRDLPPLDTR
jgi:hypothetical protein